MLYPTVHSFAPPTHNGLSNEVDESKQWGQRPNMFWVDEGIDHGGPHKYLPSEVQTLPINSERARQFGHIPRNVWALRMYESDTKPSFWRSVF